MGLSEINLEGIYYPFFIYLIFNKLSSMKKAEFNQRSKVVKSSKFEEILNVYEENKEMSAYKFWTEFVVKLDPAISYENWCKFTRKLKQKKDQKIREMITKTAENDIGIYAQIRSSAFKLGDTVMVETVDEVTELMNKGQRIPDKKKEMIMRWFFKQREVDQGDRLIDLKIQGDAREERLVDSILKESIYARRNVTVHEVETIEAEFEEVENAPTTIRQLAQGQ